MFGMRRRDFVSCSEARRRGRVAVRAQQPAKLPTIGFLGVATLRPGAIGRRFCAAAARPGLDRRPHRRDRVSLDGGAQRPFAEIATDFVRLKVDVIVTAGLAQRSRPGRRHRPPRSCFAIAGTRSAPAWSPAWRDRAATSPACRSSTPTLPASDWNSCARLSRAPPFGDHCQCRIWLSPRRKAPVREIDAAFATLARERPDALFVGPDAFFTSRATIGPRWRCATRSPRSMRCVTLSKPAG